MHNIIACFVLLPKDLTSRTSIDRGNTNIIVTMKNNLIGLFLLAAMGLSLSSAAQTSKLKDEYRVWGLGLELGPTVSSMDLGVNFDRADKLTDGTSGINFGFGIALTRAIDHLWSIRGGYHYLGTGGSLNPNRSFSGSINSFELEGVMNLSNLGVSPRTAERKFALLATGGVSGMIVNAERYAGPDGKIASVSDNNLGASIVLGLIGKYKVGRFDVDAGVRYWMMVYDKADAYIGGRGNDGLAYPFVGMTYNFGKNKEKSSAMYTNPIGKLARDVAETKAKMDGLTTDDDGDGVANIMDKDNATPAGAIVDGSGRPMDSDADGIPDFMDAQPFSARGAKVDSQGKEVDTDKDGVPDSRDAEPNSPAGELVNFQGKRIPKGSSGAVGMAGAGSSTVYFPLNSAAVGDAEHRSLAALAGMLNSNEDMTIKLVGYTDKTGPEEYNMKLGTRRAEAVKRELVNTYGIDASRISVESKGASSFLTAKRNDVNRRVEVLPGE